MKKSAKRSRSTKRSSLGKKERRIKKIEIKLPNRPLEQVLPRERRRGPCGGCDVILDTSREIK